MLRFLLLLPLSCAHTPEPIGPPQMEVVGEANYLCDGKIKAVRDTEVILRKGEHTLAQTVTSKEGHFQMELELSDEEGRFDVLLGEAKVRITGSTRFRYRVVVTLPCDDEDLQTGPARVLSEVWPEEREEKKKEE